MHKSLLHFIFLSFFLPLNSCGETGKSTVSELDSTKNEITNQEENPIEISPETMEKTVFYLASDELKGRKTGTEGIEEAALFIEDIFSNHKIQPYFSTYRDTFSVNETEAFNIVGYIEGNDPKLKEEFIIIGAHYDHVGITKALNGDDIANGANDNATGTAAVLEIAKHFSKTKKNKRSLLFVLFSAEEMGLKGSFHLSKKLREEGLNLYAMLNIEMIGIPMKDKTYSAYLTGYKNSNFAEKFNLYTGKNVFGFLPQAEAYKLFQRSDNYPFFQQFSVPAQTLSSFDFTNYDYYHHVEDEAELMDYNFMANLTEYLILGIKEMANTSSKEIKLAM